MPTNGQWIGGKQYWNGQFGAPGVVMNPSESGYGKKVSSEVNAQSDKAQGHTTGTIDKYLAGGGGSTDIYAGVQGASTGPGWNNSGANNSASGQRLDFANNQINEFKKQDAEKAAKSAAAVKGLQDFYAGLEPATSRFSRLRSEQGVDTQTNLVNGLTKNVMDTEDLIMGLEGSVNERSGDFMMNESDRTAVLARERAPLQDNLTKLLRSKQYEEVGLAGKQQLVSELLSLSYKDDEQRAKPLQLGVDFTEKDRATATELFKSILDKTTAAYSGDLDAIEKAQSDARQFDQQIQLENMRFQNDVKLKQTPSADSASSSGKTAAKSTATNTFNSMLGGAKTEYDVWKKIDAGAKSGAYSKDVLSQLWAMHAALVAKSGKGGAVRSDATQSFDFSDI